MDEAGLEMTLHVGTARLPRLLYVGDVPVASTVAGMAVLYRLLETYPPEKLRIVASALWPTVPEQRIPRVAYDTLHIGPPRPLYTRFGSLYASCLYLMAPVHSHRLRRIVADFQPEAILTVAHGYTWRTAASLASRLRLPLHLVVHDDFGTMQGLPNSLRSWADRQFGEVYRSASTRLCVSPYMSERYRDHYGSQGTVLYPLRAPDTPNFVTPPAGAAHGSPSVRIAYAGSLQHTGYVRSLAMLASVLASVDGRLIVYSPQQLALSSDSEPDMSNVTIRPTIPARDLISRLRLEADVLFVPMSFEPDNRRDAELAFPSKLSDYTATGLPLLIFGPPYCSAVRWARENPGVAEVVDRPDPRALAAAIRRLASDPPYRYELGARALEVGGRLFSHTSCVERFYTLLGNANLPPKEAG